MRHIVYLQLHCIILRLIGRNNHTDGMTMSRVWNPDYVFESQKGASASVSVSGWWRVWTWSKQMVQWNLYKTATRFYGLSWQVVFHDRENKHDFVWTVPDKLQNLCVFSKTPPVSLYMFHCTFENSEIYHSWEYCTYSVLCTTGANSHYPRSCHEAQHEWYHNIDPEQDGLNPISVFCNLSSTPVTAVLHHNQESSTLVQGYEARGSYNAEVWSDHINVPGDTWRKNNVIITSKRCRDIVLT